MLYRLLYKSSFSKFDADEIKDILKVARYKNTSNGITGALFVGNSFFVQVLEGEKNKVKDAFDVIKNDARHHDVALLELSEAPSRLFRKWSMAFISINELDNLDKKIIIDIDRSEIDNIYQRLAKIAQDKQNLFPED
jgi:hypothetical protein